MDPTCTNIIITAMKSDLGVTLALATTLDIGHNSSCMYQVSLHQSVSFGSLKRKRRLNNECQEVAKGTNAASRLASSFLMRDLDPCVYMHAIDLILSSIDHR